MTDWADPEGVRPSSRSPVSWVARPDRDTDRVRLTVWHLGAGAAGSFGLGMFALLVLLAVQSLLGPNRELFVVVVTLVVVGGPASLLYVLLAADQATARDRERFLPSTEWVRLRYLPVALLGGVGFGVALAVHPAMIYVYPLLFVAAAAVVKSRYSVGRLDPSTARLRLVTGSEAVAKELEREQTGDSPKLDTGRQHVQCYDLAPLRRAYRVDVGDYAVFGLRYRRRGWWGRPPVLVVPASTADRVETALDAVVRTSEWEPSDGMDRSVRIALGGLGLFFLVAAGALAVVATGGRGLAAIPGGLGALMVFVAIRG